MTTKEIQVPDIGDFENVPVIEILVSEGDTIDVETPLVTLESDKAAMDVPSPAAGKIREILVNVDDKVSKGSPLMVLEVEGDAGGDGAGQPAEDVDTGSAEGERESAEDADTGSAEGEREPAVAESSGGGTAPPSADTGAGGTTRVTVPDIGGFADVEVIEVHVSAGDELDAEDPMITLESDKATMDVPAPDGGTVAEVFVKTGDRVSQGDPVLSLEGSAAAAPEAEEPETSRQSPGREEQPTAAQPQEESRRQQADANTGEHAPPPTLPRADGDGKRTAPHASPSVRRFARELGVDIGQVEGSGRKGRILKEDVQGWVKKRIQEPAPESTPAAAAGGALPEMPDIDFSKFGEVEVVPLNRIKKLTAASVHRSWLHVPHVTQHEEADVTELEEFRQELKKEAADRGVKVTMLAFLVKACVAALREYPRFNASLEKGGENLVVKKYFNIGIAVDTPDGLVVPVIRNADRKGIYDLAKELGEVSQRARDRKLSPSDLQGACFTISSLGGIGGTGFTPIVNAPEVAILGVSRAQMKPVYQDGGFVPRLMLPLALSYDHRVVDGAEGARFVVFLSRVLGDARRLLL